ncbi:MAG TPA: DinB family protein, partial [Blastocatellia bacterium]|nr:DinB family protein [Blastocatellia bacterium]
LTDRKSGLPIWPDLSLEECEAGCIRIAKEMSRFINSLSLTDLDKQVFYTNSKGEPWQSSVADILTHVAMHSAYHRGQIAGQLRQSGSGPANTDFIHCARQGLID